MSISFVTGKPGGGKGLYAMKILEDELAKGRRPIITNLAVRMGPWVSGDGKPQAGLLAYLSKRYGQTFDAENRVHVITDDQCREFYRWRARRDGSGLVECEKTEAGKDGQCVAYDTGPAVENGGVLYVVDEAWKFFGAREWASTGKAALFYAAQHRKLGDDLILVTQNSKQVDTGLRMVSQDYHQIRNHGKERIGIFRQPGMFSVHVYGEPPGPSSVPMSRTAFRLDAAGLGGSYDTSAGVGIVGQAAADTGERKKGLHWGFIALAVVAVIALAVKLPFWIGDSVTGAFGRGVSKGMGAASSMVSNHVEKVMGTNSPGSHAETNSPPVPRRRLQSIAPDLGIPMEVPPVPEESGEVLTGIVKIAGKVWVTTNKRSYPPGDPALELVTREFVVIRGRVYRWPDNAGLAGLAGPGAAGQGTARR